MITALTKSPEDTRELAGALAPLSRAGDVVLLAGELGTGKTVFAQGFGRALGIQEPITSPSFTLVRIYPGRVRLVHADVYRLDHLQEVVDLALLELVDEGAVALVEWGDVAAPALSPDFLEVGLEWGAGEDERRISLRTVGHAWLARQGALSAALGRWAGGGPR
ncbi:MAG TPA: tRNA (adenosine(37)-N6)-threonylcarbamoyltransferase complex ATPase subunit type 1 TsaE [Acidimicrobiales bacterium]|nr:tRNA (adenosine(37)-N6)-threonylcarbamoyltransferase complex ATPase subunit type 1 TsaE [Acidimicrobiales bacterium]